MTRLCRSMHPCHSSGRACPCHARLLRTDINSPSASVRQLGAFGRGWKHGLAAMPVLGKQIEENPLLWMLLDDILIQFHAKSRPLREREIAVYDFGISWCSGFHPI